MEDIKVNDYVRTNEGYISKFINYGKNEGINGMSALFDSTIRDISSLVYDKDDFLFDSELKKYIVKHSPNIIDLIEVGDIIVYKKWEETYKKEVIDLGRECVFVYKDVVYENEIKEIVTKEQFNSVKYEV